MSKIGNIEHSTFNAQPSMSCRAALPWMVEAEGWMLNIFSTGGRR